MIQKAICHLLHLGGNKVSAHPLSVHCYLSLHPNSHLFAHHWRSFASLKRNPRLPFWAVVLCSGRLPSLTASCTTIVPQLRSCLAFMLNLTPDDLDIVPLWNICLDHDLSTMRCHVPRNHTKGMCLSWKLLILPLPLLHASFLVGSG